MSFHFVAQCAAFALASCMEISERSMRVGKGKNPDSVPKLDPFDLVAKHGKMFNAQRAKLFSGLDKLVSMSLILTTEGILTEVC